MELGNIIRTRRSSHGTEGMLLCRDFNCFTIELPWKNNKKNISCIPAGEYIVNIRRSPKYGVIYWVLEVKDRTYILIHSGNLAGDMSKDLKTHTYGCILLGQRRGYLRGQRAVLNSRFTVNRFMNFLEYQPFKLNILEAI